MADPRSDGAQEPSGPGSREDPITRAHTAPVENAVAGENAGIEDTGTPWAGVLVTLAGIAVAALVVWLVHPLHDAVSAAVHGDTAEVRRQIDALGAWGPIVIFGLQVIHVVVWYPAEIVDAAAGFAYGFWWGLLLVQFGWVVSGLIAYAIGLVAGRPLIHRFYGVRRFERIEAMVERGGVALLLTMRLVPIVPFSLFSAAAGTARVPVWRFTWTTAVGYVPITAISVYLGTKLESLSLADPFVLAAIAGLVGLVVAAHWLVPRGRSPGASRVGDRPDPAAEEAR
ncbi:MAG: TVP38/TMEM64 family protein [Solirubrobacterales bacterium]